MSTVTDIIILLASDDSENFAPKFGLKKVDHFAGGTKAMQCDVLMAANNVHEAETGDIVKWFFGLPLRSRESAQLLIKEEHNNTFVLYKYPISETVNNKKPAFIVCYKNISKYKGVDVFISNSLKFGDVLDVTPSLRSAKVFKMENDAVRHRNAYPFAGKYHEEGIILTTTGEYFG